MVGIAVEHDDMLTVATKAASELRARGLSAEVVASGSMKKRFDKTAKLSPLYLVSLNLTDGNPAYAIKNPEHSDAYATVNSVIANSIAR